MAFVSGYVVGFASGIGLAFALALCKIAADADAGLEGRDPRGS